MITPQKILPRSSGGKYYHIENPSVYELPIEDYWRSEELK